MTDGVMESRHNKIITKTNNEIVGSVAEGLLQCFQLRRLRKWSAGRKMTGSDVRSMEAV
jgi:hypothetical protein